MRYMPLKWNPNLVVIKIGLLFFMQKLSDMIAGDRLPDDQVYDEISTVVPDQQSSIILGTCEAFGYRTFKMSGQEHCSIQSIPSGDHQRIKLNEEAAFALSAGEKQQLLAPQDSASFAQRDFHASQLIETLKRLDPSVSEMFALKSEAVADAPLRLLKPRTVQVKAGGTSQESNESFIALSYCWHSVDWYKAPEEISRGPISDNMFFALLKERLYPAEGLWIDQLCINQDDEKEKVVAVASMDIIYKCARLVVVVLEDIWIGKSEEDVLRALIDMYKRKALLDLSTKPELSRIATGLLWKIFSARWFSRAWCGHELHVSNNQVFLIQIKGEDDVSGNIVRITAEFLHDLSIIEADFVSWVVGSDEFLSLKAIFSGRRARFNKFIYDRLSRLPEPPIQPQDNAKMPSYMRIFAETFSLQSSITSDKLSIALNISRCGLYLKGSAKTKSDCCELFTLLALAAGDSTALSSCGNKMRGDGNRFSWIQWPRPGDIVEPFLTGALHRRLDSIPACDVERLKLDTVVLGGSKKILDISEASRKKANWFMQGCLAMIAEGRYLPEEFSEQKELLIEVLACVIECGQDWIVSGVKAKGSLPQDSLLGPALETFFGDQVDDNDANREDNWEVFRQQDDFFEVLLGLLDGLLGAWLPQRPQDWTPAAFQVGSDPVNKLLIMCPQNEEYFVVIPALLTNEDYDFLNRIWIVTTSSDEYEQSWKVIGKSTSFGAMDFVKACQFGDLRPDQLFVG